MTDEEDTEEEADLLLRIHTGTGTRNTKGGTEATAVNGEGADRLSQRKVERD